MSDLDNFIEKSQKLRDAFKRQVDIYEDNFGDLTSAKPHKVHKTKTHWGTKSMGLIAQFDKALKKLKGGEK